MLSFTWGSSSFWGGGPLLLSLCAALSGAVGRCRALSAAWWALAVPWRCLPACWALVVSAGRCAPLVGCCAVRCAVGRAALLPLQLGGWSAIRRRYDPRFAVGGLLMCSCLSCPLVAVARRLHCSAAASLAARLSALVALGCSRCRRLRSLSVGLGSAALSVCRCLRSRCASALCWFGSLRPALALRSLAALSLPCSPRLGSLVSPWLLSGALALALVSLAALAALVAFRLSCCSWPSVVLVPCSPPRLVPRLGSGSRHASCLSCSTCRAASRLINCLPFSASGCIKLCTTCIPPRGIASWPFAGERRGSAWILGESCIKSAFCGLSLVYLGSSNR